MWGRKSSRNISWTWVWRGVSLCLPWTQVFTVVLLLWWWLWTQLWLPWWWWPWWPWWPRYWLQLMITVITFAALWTTSFSDYGGLEGGGVAPPRWSDDHDLGVGWLLLMIIMITMMMASSSLSFEDDDCDHVMMVMMMMALSDKARIFIDTKTETFWR